MNFIKRVFRLLHINFILAKYGLDKIILSLYLFAPLRFVIYFNPRHWFREKYPRGKAVRLALIELGPIFVKFGQALSTRPDILPADIIAELEQLQDRVPAFSVEAVNQIILEAYHAPSHEVFRRFDPQPLASASIAQVHAAELLDGCDVVVKIQRPGIAKKIERDVKLLEFLAELANRYLSHSQRLRPLEIVAEFKRNLRDELDFFFEASNASQLKRNFHDAHELYVPEIYWPYTRENILVMERIYGIPITDIEALKHNNINIKKLAERGVEIFFTQVFRDSFFHADMHPGNVFVSYDTPDDPRYIAVDFGIIGTLDERDKRYLAENFHAFFQRDYYRVAELHVESGWVPYKTKLTEFEAAIRTVCEPIFERPLREISCAQMLMRLFQVGRRFDMQVQPQLILLQKTLFSIEGLGRTLYPDLDLWKTAKPFLEDWLKKQMGPKAFIQKVAKYAPYWAERFPELPQLVMDNLNFQREQLLQNRQTTIFHPSSPPTKSPFWLGASLALIVVAIGNIWLNMSGWFDETHLQLINTGLLSVGVVGILIANKRRKTWD